MSAVGTLGMEDWHLVMEELYDTPYGLDGNTEEAVDGEELSQELRQQLDVYGKTIEEYDESDAEADDGEGSGRSRSTGQSRDENEVVPPSKFASR